MWSRVHRGVERFLGDRVKASETKFHTKKKALCKSQYIHWLKSSNYTWFKFSGIVI